MQKVPILFCSSVHHVFLSARDRDPTIHDCTPSGLEKRRIPIGSMDTFRIDCGPTAADHLGYWRFQTGTENQENEVSDRTSWTSFRRKDYEWPTDAFSSKRLLPAHGRIFVEKTVPTIGRLSSYPVLPCSRSSLKLSEGRANGKQRSPDAKR